jgi:hypothetical protein
MSDTFHACTLPWRIWPWGITLSHSDSDITPECSVEFGAMFVRPTLRYEELWTKVLFEEAAFASASPHRDDESVIDVSNYDIVPRRDDRPGRWELKKSEWLQTGTCPDPRFYYSTDSTWLANERSSWASRQRTSRRPEEAVHFLLDGRDGYVEILASGFSWRAWPEGSPRLNEVSGDPILSGRWTDGNP